MMMAPSGDMIMKSMMIVNWTRASSATRIDWYREKPRDSSCRSSTGSVRVCSVMTFIWEGERVRTCDVPPDAGPYLFWLGVISMA
jgi:hypothetical protein